MENSSKPQHRSFSLPSIQTPSSTQFEINLNKLKTLVPFSSSASIQSGLICLVDLYLCVDELIGSSHIQQVNLQYKNRVLVEEALVRSIGMLDLHTKIVEMHNLMKENVRTLQSALRRKGVAIEANGEAHILDYLLYRKKAKKNIDECLGSLEQLEKEIGSCVLGGEDHQLSIVIGILRKNASATIMVFRALLLCLSGNTKPTIGFSLIAKLMLPGKSSYDKTQEVISDVDYIDFSLRSIQKNLKNSDRKIVDVQMVMGRLVVLDHQIESYEVGLDSLFRSLVQTRVSLLNILAN